MRSGSPDSSNFPLAIYSPRKRPRQNNQSPRRPPPHPRGSMEISPLPELGNGDVLIYDNSFRRQFRPSSSILSPHLKRDKRATRGSKFFSEPASVNWSTGGSMFSSCRGRLIVMFIAGFIFPAGMFAFVSPLSSLLPYIVSSLVNCSLDYWRLSTPSTKSSARNDGERPEYKQS